MTTRHRGLCRAHRKRLNLPVWAEELLEAVDSAIPPDQLAVGETELPKAKLELLLNDGRSVEQQLFHLSA